ncbi:MAG TPA: hypothetical protein VGG99_16430 [Acetobacteraceae bacterium]|jgi:hypothetical protein
MNAVMQDPSSPDLTELRTRAEQYRAMAETARMAGSYDALLRLAGRFEMLASEIEAASRPDRRLPA